MRYIPTQQIKEFIESVKGLPEQYRNNSFEENAELTGRIVGLVFTIGAPAYFGWQMASDISDYIKFGQLAKIGAQSATAIALDILYLKSLGHTTVDRFGDWGHSIGETITNIRSSLEGLVSRAQKKQN